MRLSLQAHLAHETNLPCRPRWRSLALLALCLAPLLWPLEHLAERYYRSELAGQNRQTLDLYVANLLGTLHRYEVLPQILGDLPALRAVLGAPDDGVTQGNANRLLKNIAAQTGAEVMYLMDTSGQTLAASNWDKHDSFVGRNFSFRPYFSEAMAGRLGRFFGLGTTSAKRGYFFAAAVRNGEKNHRRAGDQGRSRPHRKSVGQNPGTTVGHRPQRRGHPYLATGMALSLDP